MSRRLDRFLILILKVVIVRFLVIANIIILEVVKIVVLIRGCLFILLFVHDRLFAYS